MRFLLRLAVAAMALLVPFAAGAATPGKKTVAFKDKDVDISISYPQTGNRVIDAALTDYANSSMADFRTYKPDFADHEHRYMMETTYEVARNDGHMFSVVFTIYADTGGAHPNTDYETFNFLLPDGALVLLPEIVDGPRGIARISQLAVARLLHDIGSGPDALSDKDSITSGAGPLAGNFRDFVWLPDALRIYFPPYQVAAYAAGPQQVTIPVNALRDVIRGNWRAPAASFDCARAASPVEKTICADAALARLDRQVAEHYQMALHNVAYDAKQQEALRQVQRDWIARRNRACTGPATAGCLTKFYRDRLADLTKTTG
jgi:uncharacterized protein YecT (DUF1311 family)